MKTRMFAAVRRYEGVADPAAAAVQVNEKFVPLISLLPGFIEYYWIDLNGGAMLSITVFKTLADAIAANEKASVWVKDHLSSVLPPASRMEVGAIVAHKEEIEDAVGAHGVWKRKLKKAITTGKIDVDIATIKADKQCDFGKWLYGPAITKRQKNSEHYREVQELHAVFHETAAKVAQLAISGEKAHAMKMLEANGEFTVASAELTTSMIAWLKDGCQ
jgi:methyl-accepting chemotaxis protein